MSEKLLPTLSGDFVKEEEDLQETFDVHISENSKVELTSDLFIA